MKRWGFPIFILFWLIGLLGFQSPIALAQSYAFEVPRQEVDLYVNPNGTITIYYEIEFRNQPGASPIDVVDIGLPNENYRLSKVKAEIDGVPLTDIEPSPYVQPGIAITLGNHTISPGSTGTLKVTIPDIEGAIGKSTLELSEPYASIVFSPSWFDKAFVRGKTDYTMTIILPPGLTTEEPRYHKPSGNWPGSDEPYTNLDAQGRVYYSWRSTEANVYTQYTFGASFPARLIPAAAIVATEVPNSRSFQISEDLIGLLCCLGFMGFFVAIAYVGYRSSQKRRLQYLPPKIAIEGHGIKRGLTAVEAAILMEQPVDKILTMILFSVLKKGAATVIKQEPLELEISQPLPEGLQPYEIEFLEAMRLKDAKERQKGLQELMVNLINTVSEKMRGFSRKETIAYYESIVKKAWDQVKAAETPEVRALTYDEVMDWTMLDRRWEDQTREVFAPGPVFVPTWWGRYDPVFRRSTPAAPVSTPSGGSKTTINLPKLPGSDFAASMVRGVETFSASVIGNVTEFTGKITARTNPPPPPTSSSMARRGGGGGSCACACACACAGCACACAGGGR
ncbi:hypothetical protein QYE77_01390 [Thermanaerothrix sp. 4228-RoL]|uniref:Protein BatD n=1 Tax=Thermanaerothrix solaris TaxID=3058434 RepID=A0ABU3NM38_9CHLR|nr:hypothetical protein [Thermanaerothrix sp. 4228-RoL]MDT8896901.1 hypothetical protein [Thermanaerothrix sp. 4228-RoL]